LVIILSQKKNEAIVSTSSSIFYRAWAINQNLIAHLKNAKALCRKNGIRLLFYRSHQELPFQKNDKNIREYEN
jgi:hypothetical protein